MAKQFTWDNVSTLMKERGYALASYSPGPDHPRQTSDWVNAENGITATVQAGRDGTLTMSLFWMWKMVQCEIRDFAFDHPRFEMFERQIHFVQCAIDRLEETHGFD